MILAIVIFALTLFPLSEKRCDSREAMQKLTQDSELIVIAEVVEIEKLLVSIWSGPVASRQWVKYKIKGVLKGAIDEPEITVRHYLVYKALTADSEIARLSPKLFSKGNNLLLFIRSDQQESKKTQTLPAGKTYLSLDPNCGSVIANEETVKMVQEIISSK
jgi:hypothetical protein